MAEVEHLVNSRPLTHISVDPTDEEVLTPDLFLISTASGTFLPICCQLETCAHASSGRSRKPMPRHPGNGG